MIRFIDLRGQIGLHDDEPEFAFYDTVVDKFVGWDQCYTWDHWNEFVNDFSYYGGWRGMDLERFEGLTPAWARFGEHVAVDPGVGDSQTAYAIRCGCGGVLWLWEERGDAPKPGAQQECSRCRRIFKISDRVSLELVHEP